MTGVNFNEDSLNIGQWAGMKWEDMNLSMCNCRDKEYSIRTWTSRLISLCPSWHFIPGRKLRVTIFTPNKQFLMKRGITRLEKGPQVHRHVPLQGHPLTIWQEPLLYLVSTPPVNLTRWSWGSWRDINYTAQAAAMEERIRVGPQQP